MKNKLSKYHILRKKWPLITAILSTLLVTNVLADELRMGFGEKLPPYIIPGSKSGIQLEIVREAITPYGHTLMAEFLPMARLPLSYRTKEVDAIMLDVGEAVSADQGFYGDVPVLYENVFITLKKRKISIKQTKDLEGLIINGFIGAGLRYPKWLKSPIKSGTYFEKNDQSLQIQQLLKGRADVVLSDHNIFKYYFLQSKNQSGITLADIDFHHVLTENPLDYRPVFRSKKMRDDFNAGLKKLRKNGRYQAIYDKYLKAK